MNVDPSTLSVGPSAPNSLSLVSDLANTVAILVGVPVVNIQVATG